MTSTEQVTAGPLVAGGDSLVRRQGHKTLFIEGALPGEVIDITVDQDRKDLALGHIDDIVTPSPHRIDPPCPMFKTGCGGCQWQHADIDAQHQYKVDIVVDALRRIAKFDVVPPVTFEAAVPQFGYRTTMRLQVVDGKPALHRRRSDDLIPLDLCMIAHPLLAELISDGFFGDTSEVSLRASVTTGERLAWIRGEATDVKLPPDVTITTTGRNIAFHEDVLGHHFRVSARSFFQSGPDAAELLAQTVDAAVPDEVEWIVDAYAGVGVLGAVVAERRDAQLTAVEQNHSAVRDARHNLSSFDAEVVEAEVATVQLPSRDLPDVVIADPGRSGLGPSATEALANLGAKTLILVSCDPASLARDTTLLSAEAYGLGEVRVLDLFPQTHHVETVATFHMR